jgi:hypothetical protein
MVNFDKYTVFKKVDLDLLGPKTATPIDDVICFRLQDRFCAPAIQAYLDAICNVIEVLEEFGMPDDGTTIEDLTMTRDWAFAMTERARTYKLKKIPDP